MVMVMMESGGDVDDDGDDFGDSGDDGDNVNDGDDGNDGEGGCSSTHFLMIMCGVLDMMI